MRLPALFLAVCLFANAQVVQESFAVDPGPLDFIAGDGQEQIILQMLTGDALTGVDASSMPVPRLATAWRKKGAGWSFTLRQGARFSDGAAVTPEDVAWTFREIQRSPRSSLAKRSYLAGVRVETEEKGVWLGTPKPLPRLLMELARIPVARRGQPGTGSGPFTLETGTDEWRLQSRPHFLSPRIPGFRFRLIPDSQAILQNLRKGWLSLGTVPPRPGLAPPPGFREIRQPTHAQLLIFSRQGAAPLKRFEIWRREAIPEGFFGPQARPSRGLWPESLGFAPVPIQGSPECADRIWKVSYAAGDELVQRLLLALRERARREGIELVPHPVEPGLLVERLERGEFGLACALNLFEPHPWSVLDYLEPGGALNFCGWSHPDYRGISETLNAPDSPGWTRLQELWSRQPGALPLLDFSSVLWVDQRLKVVPSPLGLYLTTPGPSAWTWTP